jgi:type II secretory ATPase GspE/PulE/Tfp pilus assembly ATPase PilB-like protein
MIFLFAVVLGWVPAGGYSPWTEGTGEAFKRLILPSLAIGLSGSAIIARMTRSAMLEVLRQDFVTTARAKGLTSYAVNVRHAFRNALIPVLTVFGFVIGGMLAGSVVIETVFNLRGVGRLIVDSINRRDFPVLQGALLFVTVIYLTVNLIIEYAIKEGASDIHIEPREQLVQVRYRIDGVLREANTLPKNLLLALVSRIKIMSSLKIDEHRQPQDGRFKIHSPSGTVALRVSTLPTMDGEKVVMRLLDESAKALTLDDLGFNATALERMDRAMHQPHGMILVTGPTGAGKSTTLYSVLSALNSPEVNISTVEDPVEYRMHGVNQTQVNPKAGMTFASGLRALLRQDPNIIMVGEIRDRETAQVAFQAALTGHLVFSTFHAATAAGAISRLSDMGIEPYVLRSGLRAIVSQRLVRRLCACAKNSNQPQDLLGLPLSQAHLAAACDRCLHSGYRGRMVLAELLSLEDSDELGQAILQRADAGHLQRLAEADGMTPLWTRACQAVEQGGTSPQEIRRVFGFSRRGAPQ